MKTLKDVKVGEDCAVVSAIAGNLIVQVKNSRVALDKGMANRIMIGGGEV